MPLVNVPGVGPVRFPDGMGEADIQSAIERDILPGARNTQDAAAAMTAKDTGAGEAFLVGAGRSADKLIQGVKQGALELGKRVLPDSFGGDASRAALDGMARTESEKDAAYNALSKERPIATAMGESLPYVAVPGSAGIVPAAAAVGAMEGAKYGSAGERMKNAATGAVTTGAAGLLAKGIGNFIAPVTEKAAAPGQQRALAALERMGGKPTLGEATGSTFLRRAEDYAARVPGGAGVMDDFARANQGAMNKAAAKAMGETADELSPAVFAAANRRLGQVFEAVKKLPGKPIQIQPSMAGVADDILRQQTKMLASQRDPALVELANQAKVLATHRGAIDGETYQLIRSGLSEAAFDASGTNRTLYGRLLEALDSSAQQSLVAAGEDGLASALVAARPQYQAMKILQKGATSEAGNVSPARVASALRTQNAGAFRRGEFMGPLGDLATVGEGLKPLRAGSPTFEREAISNPLSAAANAAWSYPISKLATNPLARGYARNVANLPGFRQGVEQIGVPVGRAAIAAELQAAGLLSPSFLPASQ